MIDMADALTEIHLGTARLYRSSAAGCLFNRLNTLANLSRRRRGGTVIVVENRGISSNVASDGHAGFFGGNP